MEGENIAEGIRSVVLRRGEATGMGLGLGFSVSDRVAFCL